MVIDKYLYTFSPQNPYVAEISEDEPITFKTKDCFSEEMYLQKQQIEDLDYSRLNPATGPVYVKNCEVGDVLGISILNIKIGNRGIVTTLPNTGPLIKKGKLRTKIIKIEDNFAYYNDLRFPLKPMIGVIGVAPYKESIPTGYPGNHGGNMDCKYVTTGNKIFLPVKTPGGLLQIGDLHGVMGDGEICGTGLEVSGEVELKVDIIKKFHLNWPLIETVDKWYVITCAHNYETALKYASE